MKTENPDLSKQRLKRSVLIVSALAAFLTPFLGSAITLALPSIGKEYGASAIQMGWVASSFILSSAVFLMPFGKLADIAGRKKVFSAGIALFTLSSFSVIFSHSIEFLIVLRIVQGISSAMIFGTSLAILTSVFEPGERGRAMGINITAVYAGLSGGPVIGGLLTEYFAWKSIFYFLLPVGIISLILIAATIKEEWSESKGEKFDFVGSAIYGIALAAFMYGFSKIPKQEGWIILGAGLAAGILFVLWEKRSASPVFEINLIIKNR